MRVLVHAGAVIADMAFDLDQNRRIETRRDGMLAARIENAPMRLIALVAVRSCSAALSSRSGVRAKSTVGINAAPTNTTLAGSGSHTLAASIPGRSTNARYSVPKAT